MMDENKPVRIEQWMVVLFGPDVTVLRGRPYGHPTYPDGKEVWTSAIKRVDGLLVRTKRRTYQLGQIDEAYRLLMEQHGIGIDPANPLKDLERMRQLLLQPAVSDS